MAKVLHAGGASGGDALFGQLHAGLRHYADKHHGRAAARLAAAALFLDAASRYGIALMTPGPGRPPPPHPLPRGS